MFDERHLHDEEQFKAARHNTTGHQYVECPTCLTHDPDYPCNCFDDLLVQR